MNIKKIGFLVVMLCFNAIALAQPIQTNRVLKVGTSADYPPFSFIEKGVVTGFDIDVVLEVANRLDYTVEMIDVPFKTLLPSLQLESIDIIAAGLSKTEERSKQVNFLPAHLNGSPMVILSKQKNAVQGVLDLYGKEVVVNDGYTAAQYMQAYPEVNLQYLKSTSDAISALESNRAYAFVTSKNALKGFLENRPKAKEYYLYEIKGTGEDVSLVLSKNNIKLFNEISRTLNEMLQDGTIDKLKQKWALDK